MTLILKTSATTADIIKTWFDNLNRNTSKIVQYTKFLVAGGTNVKPNLTDPDQVAALLKNNLEFIQKTIQDKVVSYLSNIKKFTGNHPYLLTCRGINRRIDNVTDALNDAINKYKKFVEAWAEREEGVDQLQIQSNKAWEIVVDGLEKIEATVKALGENILGEFSATDFTPTSPQAPQGQIPSPPIFSNAPVAGGAEQGAEKTITTNLDENQLKNIINNLKKAPQYLNNNINSIQNNTFNDWNTYSAVVSLCDLIAKYFQNINPNISSYFSYLTRLLTYVQQNKQTANQYLPNAVSMLNQALTLLEKMQQKALSTSTQSSQAETDASPAQNEQRIKEYSKKILDLINNKIQDLNQYRENNKNKWQQVWEKIFTQEEETLKFKKNINPQPIIDFIKDNIKYLSSIIGYCNIWIARKFTNYEKLATEIAAVKDETQKAIDNFNKLIQIFTEKNDISASNLPSAMPHIKKIQEITQKQLEQIDQSLTATSNFLNNNFNKLASKIHSAVEQFNHLVSLAKKQSGVATKTNPSLWSRCKSEAKSRMGGKHSARAMQLAVKLYKQRGGGYKGKKPTARTNKMKKWTKQKWMYLSDYKKKKKKDKNKLDDHLIKDTYFDSITDDQHSIKDENDAKGRYLPEAKWKSLSPKERTATDQKKKRQGKNKQYVPNTEAAKVKSKAKYY